MPRRPTRTHPLREIRNALGFSQTKFTHLIGVTTSTVKRIENGQLKISQELTGRTLLATGVIIVETDVGPKTIVCTGEPYTKESFQNWRSEFTPNSSVAMAVAGQVAKWVEILLLASARPGVTKTFQVFHSLIHALDTINRDFELQKHIDAHLAERHSTQTQLYRIGELRKNSLLAKMVNFHDDPNLKDEDQIPLTKPVGWLPNRDLFNVLWNNQDVFQSLVSSSSDGRALSPALDDKLRQAEKALESVM